MPILPEGLRPAAVSPRKVVIGSRPGLLSNDKFPGPAGVPLDIVNSRSVIGGGAGATSTVSKLIKRLREDVARLTMTALETLSVETTTVNNLVHSIMRRMIAV